MNKSGGVLSMIANYEYLPGGGNIVITGMILSWVLKSMLKNESFYGFAYPLCNVRSHNTGVE